MSLTLRRGRVTGVGERHVGLVRIDVEGVPCIAYPRLTGPVALGDDVIVNAQARELGLGSGGFDVVYANLTRGLGLRSASGAHIMKLPYTPLQVATPHVEELGELPDSLDGMPVVCCTLHSQLVPACAGLGPELRTAFVHLPGAALPAGLSDSVRALRRAGLLHETVSVGACLDGDAAAVSTASALAWAAGDGFDAAVCALGPGMVGTATRLGHGAAALAEAVNTSGALGGRSILAARFSRSDERARHRGVSHHTLAVLRLSLARVTVAWPAGMERPASLDGADVVDVDAGGWAEASAGLPLETMGRGPEEDPEFFACAFAAGRLAREWIE